MRFVCDSSDPRGSVPNFFTNLEEYGCLTVIENSGKELAKQALPMLESRPIRDVLTQGWISWTPVEQKGFDCFHKDVFSSAVEAEK